MRVKGADSKGVEALRSTTRTETIILGEIQQHLLSRPKDVDRDMQVLHVSELCKADACPLAIYHRMSGTPLRKEETTSYIMLNIWDEGSDIGERWADRVHALHRLWGQWRCLVCEHVWWGKSPKACWKCDSPLIKYNEVPFFSEKHFLAGHADIQLDDGFGPIGEVKSIGKGTMRFENPDLLDKHTYEVTLESGKTKKIIDLDAVWDDIKRPFPVHMRQGHTYGALAEMAGFPIERIFFIYECKWNQKMKEFSVKYNFKYAEPVLELALDLKYALEKRRPPRCSNTEGTCKACQAYEHGAQDDEGQGGRDGEARRRSTSREAQAGEAGPRSASQAVVRGAQGADAPDRGQRRLADEPVRSTDSVRRLRRRAVGAGRDRVSGR